MSGGGPPLTPYSRASTEPFKLAVAKGLLAVAKGLLAVAKGLLAVAKGLLAVAEGLLVGCSALTNIQYLEIYLLAVAKGLLAVAKGLLAVAKGLKEQYQMVQIRSSILVQIGSRLAPFWSWFENIFTL